MNQPVTSSIPGRVADIAAHTPDRTAAIDGDRRISFAELCAHVDRFAGWLDREGLAPGDLVGVTLPDKFQHLVACLALMRLGCPQITLGGHDPLDVRQGLAERCRVVCALAAEGAEVVSGVREIRADFVAAFGDSSLSAAHLPPPDTSHAALLCPSSGTTGRAKIIEISQRDIFERATTGTLGGPSEIVFRPISMDFDTTKRECVASLITGAALLLSLPHDMLDVVRLCHAHDVTTLRLSPALALALLSAVGEPSTPALPTRTLVHVTGSAVSATFGRAAHRFLSPKFEIGYGTAECGTVAVGGVGMFDIDSNATGFVVPGATVEAVDEDDRPLPPGTIGSLRLRSPGMATRYFDDEAQGAVAFRDGWFHPQDAGRVTGDGLVTFEGRVDEMMSLNSINIFPAEIERVVETYPGVLECAAFPLKSGVHGDIPVVAIVANDDFDQRPLLDHCRRQLGVRSPRRIFKVEKLPRSSVGKILRRELSALLSR